MEGGGGFDSLSDKQTRVTINVSYSARIAGLLRAGELLIFPSFRVAPAKHSNRNCNPPINDERGTLVGQC
jgi:hypothetical protein